MTRIRSVAELRALYGQPGERALRKQLDRLDTHCRRFVSLARFAVLSSCDDHGRLDASPRGGEPGFVRAPDEHTLLLPDWPGNNRLDTFANVVESGRAGLLLLVPGVDEVLRVNGAAELTLEEALRAQCAERGKLPKLVLRLQVEEAYLHCAKALMRAALWDADTRLPRSALPSMGQMLRDQIGDDAPAETQAAMLERYRRNLY